MELNKQLNNHLDEIKKLILDTELLKSKEYFYHIRISISNYLRYIKLNISHKKSGKYIKRTYHKIKNRSAHLSYPLVHPFHKIFVRFYCNKSKESPNPNKKYHIYLWQRLKNIPKGMRNFLFKGPLTIHKFLPLFNIMFFSVATGVLIATTTLVSLAVWIANRNERWQELMASKIGEQLTKETGIDITFENVRGSWKEGTLKLSNVKVLRDPNSFPPNVDRNVSALDLDIGDISVKISLMWWIQGNGFIEKMIVNNVKGKIDRSHLYWPDEPPPKRKWQRGDFVFLDFKLNNVDVELLQLTPNRPLRVQIHSIDCGKVRKQWILRDLLSSHSAYGIFDGSLFSLTRINSDQNGVTTHLKIDGLNLDLISASVTGPMAWIKEGTFDVSIKMNFNPVTKIESGWTYHYDPQTNSGYYVRESLNDVDPIVFDVKLKLNNLRAKIPSNTENLSYFYRALAYPVVAYMNTNYTCIPLNFKILMSESQFDGAWFPYDAGIWDALSIGVTQEFVVLLQKQKSVSNIHKHILSVLKSFHRGIYFLVEQIQGYYHLWYFNNDDEIPEDLLYKV